MGWGKKKSANTCKVREQLQLYVIHSYGNLDQKHLLLTQQQLHQTQHNCIVGSLTSKEKILQMIISNIPLYQNRRQKNSQEHLTFQIFATIQTLYGAIKHLNKEN